MAEEKQGGIASFELVCDGCWRRFLIFRPPRRPMAQEKQGGIASFELVCDGLWSRFLIFRRPRRPQGEKKKERECEF